MDIVTPQSDSSKTISPANLADEIDARCKRWQREHPKASFEECQEAASRITEQMKAKTPVRERRSEPILSATSLTVADIIESMNGTPQPVKVYPTGISWLDHKLPGGGFRAGSQYILQGPPKIGKTILAFMVGVETVAHNQSLKMLYVLAEPRMKPLDLVNRTLARWSDVSLSEIESATYTSDDNRKRVLEAAKALKSVGGRIQIERTSSMQKVRNLVEGSATRPDVLAIDPLQRMEPEPMKDRKLDSAYAAYNETIRQLDRLAMKCPDILMLTVSEINRQSQREDSDDGLGKALGSGRFDYATDFILDLTAYPRLRSTEPIQGLALRCGAARHQAPADIYMKLVRATCDILPDEGAAKSAAETTGRPPRRGYKTASQKLRERTL